ncbi:MAG: hypothetical protein P8017_16310 [Deltaproteobacteria bacterium]
MKRFIFSILSSLVFGLGFVELGGSLEVGQRDGDFHSTRLRLNPGQISLGLFHGYLVILWIKLEQYLTLFHRKIIIDH